MKLLLIPILLLSLSMTCGKYKADSNRTSVSPVAYLTEKNSSETAVLADCWAKHNLAGAGQNIAIGCNDIKVFWITRQIRKICNSIKEGTEKNLCFSDYKLRR